MDWNRIATWLERYYAGDLSLSEEQQLKEALKDDDLPEEWFPERDHILGVAGLSKEVKLSDQFEKEFNALLKEEEAHGNRRSLYWMGAVAASLTLVFSVVFWPVQDPVTSTGAQSMHADDWKAAEKAVKETQRSLALLEDQLEGSRAAFRYLEALSAPNEIDHLKKIDQIKKDLAK